MSVAPLNSLSATFRDPAGSLRLEGDWAIRTIQPSAREDVLLFLQSPFSQRLVQRGDLVPSAEDDSPDGLILRHPRFPIPSYPWEWTSSQWVAAAELTLRLSEEGLSTGWMLKDATPLNILFQGSRAVLVDVLSFERRNPADRIWLAYGQYVRTFLLPLLMHRMLGWPLALSLLKRDGYEPASVFRALGWRQRVSRDALWPITLPALLERRNSNRPATPAPAAAAGDPGLAEHVLRRTLHDLRRRTLRAAPRHAGSEWSGYKDSLTHYTSAESGQKHAWVRDVLEETRPARVLDIGANTGEFSRLAAQAGAEVVALERDEAAADEIFRMSREHTLPIHTILADISRPTPAAGWENAESSSLLARLEGQFDLVLMLAVIHHLILLEQIPVDRILALCARLTRRYLVVEWVPVTDPMFQSLMRGRDTLYGGLSELDLRRACAGHFKILRRQLLPNERVLFLLQRDNTGESPREYLSETSR